MSVKLVSWNVNGIRAASKKPEFWDWFNSTNADIINFQEVRATEDSIPEKLTDVAGFNSYFNEAEKKGYSGVGTFSKIKPENVVRGLGVEALDREGRVFRLEYSDFTLFNIYFPNSGMNAKRLDYKIDFCNALLDLLEDLKNQGQNLIITGDVNIAHNPIDVYNPANCEGKSGYLIEEREWLDDLLASGFVDTFRMFDDSGDNFTWWSYRTRARDRNAGWRLDYFFVNEEFKNKVKSATIKNDVFGSDHCPVTLELDL